MQQRGDGGQGRLSSGVGRLIKDAFVTSFVVLDTLSENFGIASPTIKSITSDKKEVADSKIFEHCAIGMEKKKSNGSALLIVRRAV